jgi:hypothetical protein
MSYSHNLSKMFAGMELVAGNLLSAGQTQDALVLLASESILRAHFRDRLVGERPVHRPDDVDALVA